MLSRKEPEIELLPLMKLHSNMYFVVQGIVHRYNIMSDRVHCYKSQDIVKIDSSLSPEESVGDISFIVN
ncbi:hypothetical protein EON65_01550 [archaeon]|nr:MAG: hypothetical protein EON65_01550 [archaeon]